MKDYLKAAGILLVITSAIFTSWNLLAYRDIEYLQEHASAHLESGWFVVTMYEGYRGGLIHGGGVWYQARDGNGYLYRMEVREWRGELHLHNIGCVNAVKNSPSPD